MNLYAAVNGTLLVVGIVCGVLILAGSIVGFVWLLLSAAIRPWREAVRAYPAPPAQYPPSIRRTTVLAGVVRLKRCVNLTAEPGGLRVEAPLMGSVVIPWEDLTEASPTRLNWQPAMQIGIGKPIRTRLTIFQSDFDHLRQIRSKWHDPVAKLVDKQGVGA